MAEFKMLDTASSEAQFQQAFAYLFANGGTPGLATDGVLTGLAVTQTATAGTSVLVGTGMGVVQDTVLNGAAVMVNNAQKTQDVLVANPAAGSPRNDIVVFDSATATIRVITGTPNAIPTDPTVPATAFPLARLRILASATTIPTAQIDDLRVFTGLFGVSNSYLAVPASMIGKRVFRKDFTSATTDASGFLTVTHGAPFTPTAAVVTMRGPAGSFAAFWGADAFTATTARLRFLSAAAAGAFASAATGAFTAIFWE